MLAGHKQMELSYTANRIQNGTAMFLVKLNIHLSFDPAILFLDNILSELKTYVHI